MTEIQVRGPITVPLAAVSLLASLLPGTGLVRASGQDVPIWRVEDSPSVTIGGDDDRPDYIVFGVVAATRLSDGTIVVASQRSTEVKYFDAEGVHLVTAGEAGEGPGEYAAIIDATRLPGDTVVVLSRSPGLSWLSPTGDFVRSVRVDWVAAELPCRLTGLKRQLLGDASILAIAGDNFGNPGCPAIPPSPWRETALLFRQDVANEASDTIAILPGDERNSPNYRVFGGTVLLASGADRLYAADTRSEEILVLDFLGDTIGTMAIPFSEVAVPRRAKQLDVRRFTLPSGEEQTGTEYLYPDTYPRLGRLMVDGLEYLWAMAYPEIEDPIGSNQLANIYGFVVPEGGGYWRVLDRDGAVVAEVRTPDGLFPLEIGEDYVLGVSKDEYDVEAVQLYRLTRPGVGSSR